MELAARPDANKDPAPWLKHMERIAEGYEDDQRFLQWHRRLFDLYILVRWLDVYSHLFLSLPNRIEQGHSVVSLVQLMRPLTDPALSGSGIWAPAIDRTLGYGVCFVIRELVRLRIIDGQRLEPYAWQPTRRLRDLLRWLGMSVENETRADSAPEIWRYISTQTDSNRARFGGSFDLPLQLLTTERLRQDRNALVQRAGIEAEDLDAILDRPEGDLTSDIAE